MKGTEYDNQQGAAPATDARPQYTEPLPAHEAEPRRPRATGRKAYKSPTLAGWLSLGPGLGQVYVGYYLQGFINIAVVASVITLLASGMGDMTPFLGIFLAFFWLWNILDANRRATHYNRAMAGLGGDVPPEDFQVPGTGGSIFGGILLIAIGLLFFLDLKFGISMEWIGEWWPLILVGGGVYLVMAAINRRKED